GRVRTTAGLDADDALGHEGLVPNQELRVLLGVDVVRHHRDLVLPAQRAAQRQGQRGLARSHRPADADPERHDLNSLEYWLSCLADNTARPGAKFKGSSSTALSAISSRRLPKESKILCPAVWPSGTALI